MGAKLKTKASLSLKYFAVLLMCCVILLPILIFLLSSFKTNQEFAKTTLFQLPEAFDLENYKQVFIKGHLLTAYRNTLILLLFGVTLNILFGTMLAYALGRFQFRARGLILAMIMGARVIPTITTQVATFTVIKSIGLYDTLWAPILLYAGTDVVQIFLYLQFIESIPYELDESAKLAGASNFRIYWDIILPLMKPATVTAVILKVVAIYNDMYIPYLYLASDKNLVISTALLRFNGSAYGSQVPILAASFILVMIPMLILCILAQNLIFDGITAGSVKG